MGRLAFERHGDVASISFRKTWHSDWPIVTRNHTREIEKEKIIAHLSVSENQNEKEIARYMSQLKEAGK